MVGGMVEAAATQDRPVFRVRPSDQKRPTIEEALQSISTPWQFNPRVVVEAAVQPLEMEFRSPCVVTKLDRLSVSMSQLPIVEIDPIHPAI